MDTLPNAGPKSRLGALAKWAQWAIIIIASVLAAVLLHAIHLPAALLIGPLIVGILAGVNNANVRVPTLAFAMSQAAIGCLIASSVSLDIFATLIDEWPLVVVVVASTIAASSLLGWLISRYEVLPGTTGVWGAAPGAATPMVLMAGAFGADQRLVAFMQYLRVIIVTFAAALVARFWVDTSTAAPIEPDWFPALDPVAFGATIVLATTGALLGRLLRFPAPYFLGVFLLAGMAHLGFDVPLQLPEWLLAISYAVIGWTIGLNFTMPILRHGARALPQIVGSILALVAFCGFLAWIITLVLDVDPLTAYLATSPGGMDSIAIIAAASNRVDISFVMALQAARFLVVLLIGPSIARAVARSLR